MLARQVLRARLLTCRMICQLRPTLQSDIQNSISEQNILLQKLEERLDKQEQLLYIQSTKLNQYKLSYNQSDSMLGVSCFCICCDYFLPFLDSVDKNGNY